jgi:hypothetical protein
VLLFVRYGEGHAALILLCGHCRSEAVYHAKYPEAWQVCGVYYDGVCLWTLRGALADVQLASSVSRSDDRCKGTRLY